MSEYIVYFAYSEYEVFSNLEGCRKYIEEKLHDGFTLSNFIIYKEVPFKTQIKLEIGD
jgi:hypothetical protein